MCALKQILDDDGHGILEMPTGTGKTVCLLSLILSVIKYKKRNFKLIYCTRTIVEMEKTLAELKFIMRVREKDFGKGADESVLAICLSARHNMCVHPEVIKEHDRIKVDA